jgi:protoheme IX farnesyltransferase
MKLFDPSILFAWITGNILLFALLVFFTRAGIKRVIGVTFSSIPLIPFFMGVDWLAIRSGWWHYPGNPVASTLMVGYGFSALGFGAGLGLIGWRFDRRWGRYGLAAYIIGFALLGLAGDVASHLVGKTFLYGSWPFPLLLDLLSYAGAAVLVQGVMHWIIGPARSDRLSPVFDRVRDTYWPLIKSRQTALLTLTGIAGFLSQRPFPLNWSHFIGLIGSLFITISGCTVLNMVFDRDIDRKMARTNLRPLAANRMNVGFAAWLGSVLLAAGLIWAGLISIFYCFLVFAGALLDVLVYTLLLKRRSSWSIILGGLSGGMPFLAGSDLAAGRIPLAALLLAFAVVCWIPSHNLTLGMLYPDDYHQAGIPTFVNVYGADIARNAVAVSSFLTVLLVAFAFVLLRYSPWVLAVFGAGSFGQLGLAFYGLTVPPPGPARTLYKYSSVFMLAVMLLLSLAAWV